MPLAPKPTARLGLPSWAGVGLRRCLVAAESEDLGLGEHPEPLLPSRMWRLIHSALESY